MGTRDYYQKVVVHACMICGDEARFANALGVSIEQAVDWLLGSRPVPAESFLKAVDIVLAGKRTRLTRTRAFLDEVRRRHAVRRPVRRVTSGRRVP